LQPPSNFKDISKPNNHTIAYPDNQEGLKWIEITSVKKSYKGHKLDKYPYNDRKEQWNDLVGKIVVLIYPNCD